MTYTLGPFFDSLPSHHQFVPLDLPGFGLHIAHWPANSFADLREFQLFCWRYSCVMQAYIVNPQRTDLASWFAADPSLDERIESDADFAAGNISAWFAKHYPQVHLEWLRAAGHAEMSASDGEYPEMQGRDSSGYYEVFAADNVDWRGA